MPTIVTRQAPRSPALDTRQVRRVGDQMLAHVKLPDAELSILLTGDERIRVLNREHRSKDRPTDVLAFPLMDADDAGGTGGPRLLGDVVISLDTAASQASQRGQSLMDEVTFLLAHGLLHLLGYDHQTDAEELEMTGLTRKLVAATRTANSAHGRRSQKG